MESRAEKRREVNPYMAVVLGFGRGGASRRGHRGGAVGCVLLWRAGFVQTILWWGVRWAGSGCGWVLHTHTHTLKCSVIDTAVKGLANTSKMT